MHNHDFSVMVVENGFVIQELYKPYNKTKTLVARTDKELIKVLKIYIKHCRTEQKAEAAKAALKEAPKQQT